MAKIETKAKVVTYTLEVNQTELDAIAALLGKVNGLAADKSGYGGVYNTISPYIDGRYDLRTVDGYPANNLILEER